MYSPEAYARALEAERERKRARRAVSRDKDHAYYERVKDDPEFRERQRQYAETYRASLTPEQRADQLKRNAEVNRARRAGEGREKVLALQRASYERNKEKCAERNRAWREKNWERLRDVHNGYWRKRRALLANAEGSFTQDEWLAICERQNGKCFDCGQERRMTIGHLVPLCKGGSNWPSNIVAQCQRCNSSQGQRIHPSLLEASHG